MARHPQLIHQEQHSALSNNNNIVNCVEDQHLLGATVTNQKLRHEIFSQFEIELARSTVQNYLHRLGLSWRPTKPRAKTFKAYRSDAIGSYLIDYVAAKKRVAEGEVVAVCTDESFIHQGHQRGSSYFGNNSSAFNKKSGKGPRLIILHAMAEDGPICDYEDGKPIDDLVWNGNTPHPHLREDGQAHRGVPLDVDKLHWRLPRQHE